MDEADVTQKARAFVAKVDVSGIREDLTPYVVAANAKVKKEELSEGESGYTITKPNGKHEITVRFLVPNPGYPVSVGLDYLRFLRVP